MPPPCGDSKTNFATCLLSTNIGSNFYAACSCEFGVRSCTTKSWKSLGLHVRRLMAVTSADKQIPESIYKLSPFAARAIACVCLVMSVVRTLDCRLTAICAAFVAMSRNCCRSSPQTPRFSLQSPSQRKTPTQTANS